MSLQEIELAVRQLEPSDFKELRRWIAEYDMALWDKQIESDSESGRLHDMINKAREEYSAGKYSCL